MIAKHWVYLGRSSATRELGKWDFMIIYRKPPSLKDSLVRAKIPQPPSPFQMGVKDYIPTNTVAKFPSQVTSKTYKATKLTTH